MSDKAEGFGAWINDVLRPRLLERGLRARVVDRGIAQMRFLPEVLEKQANQKEFTLPIWEYLEIATSDERTRNGRQMLRKHRDLFLRIEQTFGVEPAVVAAIWGLETGYGLIRGDTPVIAALATLAYGGRRATFFEDELTAALRIVQAQDCPIESMIGSWSGAMGHGQFMPSSILDFAVDFDADGAANLCCDDPTDALASIANYLAKHGWKKGQPWAFEVSLPQGFDYARTGADQTLPSHDWAELGVRCADGSRLPDYGPGSILLPAGAGGVALLILRNFFVITSYNRAEAYAIGIAHLSDRIAGGKPFAGSWPTGDRAMEQSDIAEAQDLLTQAGFDTHGVDGMRGPNTTRAVRAFQMRQGLAADGYVNDALLARLRDAKPGQDG